MTKLMISTESSGKLFVGENRKSIHSNLLNLEFEKSGHTGFQKELTEEQLEAIDAVHGKEDKLNKITEITEESTDEQYPTAKAVYRRTHHIEEMVVAVAQGTADAISRTDKLTADVDSIKAEKADTSYVDESIQSAILDSWEVAV